MKILKKILILMIISAPLVQAQELGNPNCDSLLLVSSWSQNNVKIYDGCDGTYIKNLAETGILAGPQAIFQDHNGDVIVVSESNHQLVKFDKATLTTSTTVIPPGVISNPITAVKKDETTIYLGSYSRNNILEIDTQTWQTIRTILPANNNLIQGIDIGMALGPDGHLYVPGYDSDNILKVNPMTGESSQFVASGNQGLDKPRSILFLGDKVLVTASGNQAILSYDFNGQNPTTEASSIIGAAGMAKDGSDHILVTSDTRNNVKRYHTNDFSSEQLVASNSGGLRGATFVYRLQKTTPVTDAPHINQAWVTGVGTIEGNTITLTEVAVTQGGTFGDQFDPNTIETILWGELTIIFNGCHQADMTYSSVIAINNTPFGTGGYPIERIAMNTVGRQCEMESLANSEQNFWMSGTFYGGPSRNGEGFNIDVLENNRAIISWYTYLPDIDQ